MLRVEISTVTRRLVLVVGLVMAAFLSTQGSTAWARPAEQDDVFRGGDRVEVGANETVPNDLFAAAETVTIDGTVQGDVGAIARRVVVNGTVNGDLWAAAQSVEVKGRVLGDVRVFGETLVVDGSVGGNVQGGAGREEVGTEGNVGGDMMVYTERVVIKGRVQGDVTGRTEEYQNTGTVEGEERITIEKRVEDSGASRIGDWLLGRGRHWLALMLVGGVAGLVWRRPILAAADTVRTRPLASLGGGLVVLAGGLAAVILVPIVFIIAAIALGLLGLGGLTAVAIVGGLLVEAAIVLGIAVSASFVAGVAASLVVGQALLQRRFEGSRFEFWAWLSLGALLYVIAAGLPYVGPVVQPTVAVLGLGALGLRLRAQRRVAGSRFESA